MAGTDGGDKKYEASDLRREQFRKEGRFARSRDAASLAAAAALFGTLYASREGMATAAPLLFTRTIGDLGRLERVGVVRAVRDAALPLATELAPALAGAAVAAFVVGFAQAGFRPNTALLAARFDRLDPSSGFSRLFSFKKNAIELVLALMRVGAAGYVGYRAAVRELPTMLAAAHAPFGHAAVVSAGAIGSVVTSILVGLVVLAAIDYAQSRFSLEREMRMTHTERMEESRQQEGDPKAKGRMKSRARALAKKRALASVKSADVVVTNPTHVAVALRYGPRDAAPVVVAKGHDEVALRIRALARRHGIPVLENRPLARALDASVPVGRPIPQAHFSAVAQVLAFVYRLRKRGALGGMRRA
jgi:flagellar biosynthetic protein FlhB